MKPRSVAVGRRVGTSDLRSLQDDLCFNSSTGIAKRPFSPRSTDARVSPQPRQGSKATKDFVKLSVVAAYVVAFVVAAGVVHLRELRPQWQATARPRREWLLLLISSCLSRRSVSRRPFLLCLRLLALSEEFTRCLPRDAQPWRRPG